MSSFDKVLFGRQIAVYVGPKGGQGILLQGLKMTFHIERSLEKQPNPAKIEITNLSPSSIAFIENIKVNGIQGPYVVLRAGYNVGSDLSQLPKLYEGDIAKFTAKKNGTDTVSTLECGDGEATYLQSKADISFAPGSLFGTVMDTLQAALGIGKGSQIGINRADPFLNGISLSGSVKDHLDVLTKRQSLIWSIQDGKLQVLPKGGMTTQSAVLLTNKTGLIGSPFKTKVIRQELTNQAQGVQISGTKFLSLLNNNLVPGRPVVVQSQYVNGTFRIDKATHSGDTHSNPWYTEIECR